MLSAKNLLVQLGSVLAIVMALSAANGVSPAQEGGAKAAADAPDEAAPRAPQPRALSPMMLEIRAVVDEADALRDDIERRLGSATDQAQASELQQELASVKLETEIRILRVQAKHALLAGRVEQAQRIEEVIQRRLDPPAPRLRELAPGSDEPGVPRR